MINKINITSTFKDTIFGQERALYGVKNALISGCSFEGAEDGESALKEASEIHIADCRFLLRYPLWHVTDAEIERVTMTDTCRAAMWYDKNMKISDSLLGGIKALRECENVIIKNTSISSVEFGWFCKDLTFDKCSIVSEYPFLKSENMEFEELELKGKYSFQYVKNVTIKNSVLDTKDAFWHSENVTVYDSVVKGEYLGWYSKNLKLVRCKIIGTQPMCYAENLELCDCEMIDCDLSFELSSVNAKICGHVISIKNPLSGLIEADSIGDIITDDPKCKCTIKTTEV